MRHRMSLPPAACALIAGLLAASAPALAQQQAAPQKRSDWSNPIDSMTRSLKLQPDPVDSADFVKQSRPAEMDFIPVGRPKAEPSGKLLTLDELRAKEAELDAAGARHDQIAGRHSAKVAYNPVAREPKPKKVKKKFNCAITCEVKPNTPPERTNP